MSVVVALLGAESTGKTTLSNELAAVLRAEGRQVALVPETLREFCDQRGRTPWQHEQQGIADEQTRRIGAAAASHDIVVADTTALMIAVYSDYVFGDTTLYASAQRAHRTGCNLTLLTALDLPWHADPQRDGPHAREPVDLRVRAALAQAGIAHSVVFGHGQARMQAALSAVRRALAPAAPQAAGLAEAQPRWHWHCERCGDALCERHARLPKSVHRSENDVH